MKTIHAETLKAIIEFAASHTLEETRAEAERLGVMPTSTVKATDLDLALEARDLMRNYATDYGAHGKQNEADGRLHENVARGARWFRWSDLTARKPGKTDMFSGADRKATERKTGAGDWLRSTRYSTREDIVAEYSTRESLIDWNYELAGFRIVATWKDFMEYLGQFKGGKGAAYWFKKLVRYSSEGAEVVVQMQPLFKGTECQSRVKLDYLLACPYNVNR